jgi:hypothetical protein
MYESRNISFKKKPRIILDKQFKEFNSFQVGDKGQCMIKGSIVSDRKEPDESGTEFLVKTVEINEIEIIDARDNRTSSSSL